MRERKKRRNRKEEERKKASKQERARKKEREEVKVRTHPDLTDVRHLGILVCSRGFHRQDLSLEHSQLPACHIEREEME